MGVESTSKCKIFFCRTRILVFEDLVSVLVLCIIAIFLSVKSSKLACFGIYCLMSLFVFSTAPFCHEAYGSAK